MAEIDVVRVAQIGRVAVGSPPIRPASNAVRSARDNLAAPAFPSSDVGNLKQLTQDQRAVHPIVGTGRPFRIVVPAQSGRTVRPPARTAQPGLRSRCAKLSLPVQGTIPLLTRGHKRSPLGPSSGREGCPNEDEPAAHTPSPDSVCCIDHRPRRVSANGSSVGATGIRCTTSPALNLYAGAARRCCSLDPRCRIFRGFGTYIRGGSNRSVVWNRFGVCGRHTARSRRRGRSGIA